MKKPIPSSSPTSDRVDRCQQCGAELPAPAVLCSKCGSYVAGWKNTLKFLSTNVALFAAVAAGISYVITGMPELRKTLFWRDSVKVISLSTIHGLTVVNDGDGPLYITNISYREAPADGGFVNEGMLEVNELVAERSVLRYDFIARMGLKEDLGRQRPFHVAGDKTRADWRKRADASGDLSAFATLRSCYHRVLSSTNDPSWLLYKRNIRDRLEQYEVTATLHVYSPAKQRLLDVPIPSVGYLISGARTPECLSKRPLSQP